MKKLIYLLIVLSFSNCNNRKEFTPEKSVQTEDSSELGLLKTKLRENQTEIDDDNADTLVKKSQPFKINNINCYWELSLFLHKGETSGLGKLELRNLKSQEIILSTDDEDYYGLDEYDNWHSYNRINFDHMNDEVIKDVNFDGHKDFILYHRSASGSAGEFFNVHLFNPTKKAFEKSKALSGYNITLDTINKTVSSYAKNGASYNVSHVIHFDKNGKTKYAETTERETIETTDGRPLFKVTYKKVMNAKIVITQIDTVTDY
jgi:hypothetical protein